MNYYEETLKRIQELLDKKAYDQALHMINEELIMPYIPQEFEAELKKYQNEIYEIVGKPVKPVLTGEQIFALLNDQKMGLNEKVGLFAQLEKINLRNFYEPINIFLKSSNPTELKTILVYLLANQEIDHEFVYEVNHQLVKINPRTFDFKKTELIIENLNQILETILPQDYLQLEQMAKIVIANLYYKLFPNFEGYDWEKMGQAIKNRLLIVNGINEEKTEDETILGYEKLLMNLEIV